jgi:hypothetical protein
LESIFSGFSVKETLQLKQVELNDFSEGTRAALLKDIRAAEKWAIEQGLISKKG